MTDRLLVVEDDQDIIALLKVNLAELGLPIDYFSDGALACQAALNNDYILMLLDIMLPNVNGLDICRQVRQAKPEQAILMLTAKSSEVDRVLGLELGADDYLTKPFSIPELQARMRAQIRKAQCMAKHIVENKHNVTKHDVLISEALHVYPSQRKVQLGDTTIELTATEFDLLHHLMVHAGQVFSRNQLLESVWGYTHSGYEHTVNSTMNRLRSKIEDNPTQPHYLQTVWGVGYKFNA